MGGSLRGVGVGAAGVTLTVLALASIPLLNWIIRKEVTKRVIIANNTDSELYPIWANPSMLPGLYFQVYPFHVKNPDEVVNGGKAILEQRGPYTYREYRRKENIVFNDNGTVSYIERKWYKFLRNMSVGYDNETFTTINIPVVALASLLRYNSGTYQDIVSRIISLFPSEKLFVTKKVEEIVFGYTDELLSWGKTFDPSLFTTDKVGILVGKNNSYDGEYTIFTGEKDITQLGKIDKFNGTSSLNFWTTKYANMINGSADGSVFAPFISDDFVAELFSMDICRSATAVFFEESHISKHRVKVRRFRAPKAELEKPSLNPDNAGFCTPYGNCLGSGVLNISSCQKIDGFHVPVVISFPHFYLAEKQYVDGVVGMKPSGEFATEVDIEPTTGLVMKALKKIQMNFYLERSDSFKQLKKVRTTIFPVLWVNESVTIDDEHAAKIKNELLVPQAVAQITQYIVIGLGVLLFLVGTFLVARGGTAKTVRVQVNEPNGLSSTGRIQCSDSSTSLPRANGGVNHSRSSQAELESQTDGGKNQPHVQDAGDKSAQDTAAATAAAGDSYTQSDTKDTAPLLSE